MDDRSVFCSHDNHESSAQHASAINREFPWRAASASTHVKAGLGDELGVLADEWSNCVVSTFAAIVTVGPRCPRTRVMAVLALARRGFKARQPHNVLPIIQQRRELQEELNSLASPELATAIPREASRQLRRPVWDTKVLEAAVRRALSTDARKTKKWTGSAPVVR